MSTTLTIESFNPVNLRERTTLSLGVQIGASVLMVASTEGYADGDIIYIGELSREGCEKAVIAAVDDETTLSLVDPVGLPHTRFEPVTSVLGDLIHIYRAANIDDDVPPVGSFTVLATRSIHPDQLSTYYTDSAGSSQFWYRSTYYNATTLAETDVEDSTATRGDDFGHYASLREIRDEAGFDGAVHLSDTIVDQQRRAAEAEINTALANTYDTPFQSPVPEMVRVLTIKLAAGMLLQWAYGEGSFQSSAKLKEARSLITDLQGQNGSITDGGGTSLSSAGISYYPDADAPRAFHMGDKF